jgi:hypothetical protein
MLDNEICSPTNKRTPGEVAYSLELTDQTRQAIDDYLKATGKKPGEFLFTGRRSFGRYMTTRQASVWTRSFGHRRAPASDRTTVARLFD